MGWQNGELYFLLSARARNFLSYLKRPQKLCDRFNYLFSG